MQNIKYCKLAWDFCDLKGMCSLYSNGPNFLEGRRRYLCLQSPQYWAPNCPSCFTNKAILSTYNSIGNEHCYHDYFIDKRTWERSQDWNSSSQRQDLYSKNILLEYWRLTSFSLMVIKNSLRYKQLTSGFYCVQMNIKVKVTSAFMLIVTE